MYYSSTTTSIRMDPVVSLAARREDEVSFACQVVNLTWSFCESAAATSARPLVTPPVLRAQYYICT
jgi:hypothetical protein